MEPPRESDPAHAREGFIEKVDSVVEGIERAVPHEVSARNDILLDRSRTVSRLGIVLAVSALVLVPWTIYLALTLPRRALSPNYDWAWAGFDVMLLCGLGAAAVAALRRSRWTVMTASWAAAMLVTDAWFDVLTSTRSERFGALVMALLAELPLAALCIWLAVRSVRLDDTRIRRARRTGRRR